MPKVTILQKVAQSSVTEIIKRWILPLAFERVIVIYYTAYITELSNWCPFLWTPTFPIQGVVIDVTFYLWYVSMNDVSMFDFVIITIIYELESN